MSKKLAPKDARKRTRKPGKIADLPVKPLASRSSAEVKGGFGSFGYAKRYGK